MRSQVIFLIAGLVIVAGVALVSYGVSRTVVVSADRASLAAGAELEAAELEAATARAAEVSALADRVAVLEAEAQRARPDRDGCWQAIGLLTERLKVMSYRTPKWRQRVPWIRPDPKRPPQEWPWKDVKR